VTNKPQSPPHQSETLREDDVLTVPLIITIENLCLLKTWTADEAQCFVAGRAPAGTLYARPNDGTWSKGRRSANYAANFCFERELFRRDDSGAKSPKDWVQWCDSKSICVNSDVRAAVEAQTANGASIESQTAKIDFSLLATPDQLITAFGKYGLNAGLFKNVTNSRWLLNARKVKGVGKKGQEITPMFCPYEVMRGALKSSRIIKNNMNERQGWIVLKQSFPKAYEPYASYSELD
jgi:hypothetical protein